MSAQVARRLRPVSLRDVSIEGGFWGPRLEVNRAVTLAVQYEQLKKSGRLAALKQDWAPGKPNKPHPFWDSDIAKWLEAAAHSLAAHPDRALEKRVDEVVIDLALAQQDDGYLNSYFTTVEPENRWANLRDMHELYCAGHLIEAAVAYYEATGKRRLLDVVCHYADHIDRQFGPSKGQRRGYPGHEEIELALVKLHRATAEKRRLELARFFIDERGRLPHYFHVEALRRGEDTGDFRAGAYAYAQAHAPVREQKEAVGHAVRAMYLYSGMTDVAAETGDQSLAAACKRLWKNLTERRMYITGGVGPAAGNEGFTFDYDLPNETAYAETCAAIGLVFWAHRMLQLDPDRAYADVMERALYNGVLSGVSLDGKAFFYANPLAVFPKEFEMSPSHVAATRQPWFGCACCPPNLARLLASLGQYAYAFGPREIRVHLYVQGRAAFQLDCGNVILKQETAYPWRETVRFTVEPEKPGRFVLALRIPGWCRGAKLKVNGKSLNLSAVTRKGYARIRRDWSKGDTVELALPMPVERIRAHPKVRADLGRVALQRGPVVYCFEEVDNGPDLDQISLPSKAPIRATYRKMLGGAVVLTAQARRVAQAGRDGGLYASVKPKRKAVRVTAVPYCLWNNRKPGEMLVWIRDY